MNITEQSFKQGLFISVTYRGYEGRTQSVIDVPNCLQNA